MKNCGDRPKANANNLSGYAEAVEIPFREGIETLPVSIRKEMEKHARSESEAEVCGFVYADRYIPLRNVSGSKRRFYADPAELARVLLRYGEPQAIFHTHTVQDLALSSEDLRMWYYSNSTMIVGCLENGHLSLKMYGNRRH